MNNATPVLSTHLFKRLRVNRQTSTLSLPSKLIHGKFKIISFFILLSSFYLIEGVCAQSIFTNPINGTDPGLVNPFTSGQIVDPNITVLGIGRLTVNGENLNNVYNASNWTSATTIDLAQYFEFVLTPNSGYALNFVSFVYTGTVAASKSPQQFAFRSSVDNFSTNIGAPTGSGTTISLSGASYQNITSAIIFRIYGWAAKSSGTPSQFGINDFTFNGTVCAAPVITGQPLVTQTVCQNATPTNLSVTATGTGLSYQWYSNTSNSNTDRKSVV